MSGRKGMVHYRVELKQEAVRLVLEDHLTYTKVATQLAIRKRARMYRKEGEVSFHLRSLLLFEEMRNYPLNTSRNTISSRLFLLRGVCSNSGYPKTRISEGR